MRASALQSPSSGHNNTAAGAAHGSHFPLGIVHSTYHIEQPTPLNRTLPEFLIGSSQEPQGNLVINGVNDPSLAGVQSETYPWPDSFDASTSSLADALLFQPEIFQCDAGILGSENTSESDLNSGYTVTAYDPPQNISYVFPRAKLTIAHHPDTLSSLPPNMLW